jgi:hypothetical protein
MHSTECSFGPSPSDRLYNDLARNELLLLWRGVVANGQVVLVTTEGLSGGPPMRTVYYVAEEDPTKAQAIIAKVMAPNEEVEAYGLLPEAAVEALGLKPGEFRSA